MFSSLSSELNVMAAEHPTHYQSHITVYTKAGVALETSGDG